MKFRLTGMRRDLKKSAEAVKRTLAKPEVTRPPSQLKPRSLGRAAFHPKAAAQRSQPENKKQEEWVGYLAEARKLKPEARNKRWAVLPTPPPGARQITIEEGVSQAAAAVSCLILALRKTLKPES